MAITRRRPDSNSLNPYHRGSVRQGRRRPLDDVQRNQLRFWITQHRLHGRLTPARALVGLAILAMVNRRDGACFPSYVAIAAWAGVAESTVGLALRDLRALSLLEWDMRIVRLADGRDHQTSNAYVFVIVARVRLPIPADFLLSPLKKLESCFTPTRHEVVTKPPSAIEAALASFANKGGFDFTPKG